MLLTLLLSSTLTKSDNNLEILMMGDWGGQPSTPYYTKEEQASAKQMGSLASTLGNVKAVIGLGDNFYNNGVKNEKDPRFKETFEDVFTADSLKNLPFYMIAGNHDHYGNVTAEIAYNNKGTGRWKYPDWQYSISWNVPNSQKTVQLLLFDTVIACGGSMDLDFCQKSKIPLHKCKLQPTGPDNPIKAENQWTWLENELKASKANYLLIGGHYPVWSIAEHGPTSCLVDKLRPLLIQYNVTAFVSGHDHTFEYLLEDQYQNLGYIDTGGTHYCDPSTAHTKNVPKNSLKFHNCNEGGFTRFSFSDTQLKFYYYFGKDNNVQYSNTLKPRF